MESTTVKSASDYTDAGKEKIAGSTNGTPVSGPVDPIDIIMAAKQVSTAHAPEVQTIINRLRSILTEPDHIADTEESHPVGSTQTPAVATRIEYSLEERLGYAGGLAAKTDNDAEAAETNERLLEGKLMIGWIKELCLKIEETKDEQASSILDAITNRRGLYEFLDDFYAKTRRLHQ